MHHLFSFLKSLWGLLERIFIYFSRLLSPQSLKGIFKIIPYLVVILVFIGLAILQAYEVGPFKVNFRHPLDNTRIWGDWFNKYFFWSTLWLLFVAACLLIRYIIKLLSVETIEKFPDILDAWAEGMDALDRAGMDFRNSPVFVMVGLTHEAEHNFETATEANWRDVRPALDDRTAPLRFWLHKEDAIYVSLPGVCATSRQSEKPPLGSEKSVSDPSQTEAPLSVTGTITPDQLPTPDDRVLGTMMMQDMAQYPVGRTMPAGTIAQTLSADELEQVRQAGSDQTMMPDSGGASKLYPPTLTPEEIEESGDRMAFFCSLCSRERGLLSPINGAAVLMPLQYAQADAPLNISATRQDLEILHQRFELLFPVLYLYGGLEKLPGLPEFLRRGNTLNPRFVNSRGGARFRLGNSVDEESATAVTDKGVQWFRDWTFKGFERDLNSPENRKLFHFLRGIESRREELRRWLLQTFPEIPGREPARLAGCYFAALGRAGTQSGFVPGALNRFLEQDSDGEYLENKLAWMPRRRQKDRFQRAWATFLIFVSGLMWLAAVALVIYVWGFKSDASSAARLRPVDGESAGILLCEAIDSDLQQSS